MTICSSHGIKTQEIKRNEHPLSHNPNNPIRRNPSNPHTQ